MEYDIIIDRPIGYKDKFGNIYPINYGFDVNFQDIYIDVVDSEIKAVILKYKENVIPYYKNDKYDVSEMIKILSSLDVSNLSGKKSIVDKIKCAFNIVKDRETYFCELTGKPNDISFDTDFVVIKATTL